MLTVDTMTLRLMGLLLNKQIKQFDLNANH
ncbi:MAG: Uncharacterised protein [Flavobacteriaceae bacterium]|nr:MAG: Uncharacterised protein [Flavobacteriaceae bacterium]